MTRPRKHIALLLFGIFFFPVIFQPLHLVTHHSHDHECEHHLCYKDKADIDFHSTRETVISVIKLCPICEYHFPVNDLPDISVLRAAIPAIACIFNEIATQQQYKQVFTEKSPRGPPIFIS